MDAGAGNIWRTLLSHDRGGEVLLAHLRRLDLAVYGESSVTLKQRIVCWLALC